MVVEHVKEKLWQALLSEADVTEGGMKGRFNHAFNHNASLQMLITALQTRFLEADLSFKQIQKNINEYFGHFDSVVPQYIAEVRQLSDVDDLAHAFQMLEVTDEERANGVELAADMIEDTEERMRPNQRDHFSDERLLRRMDSLARLLSLQSKASVCTAVTIHDGQLFIGANVSGETSQAEMIDVFKARLQILRRFINRLSLEAVTLDSPMMASKIKQCVSDLVTIGGTSKPLPMLEQALFKLVDALRARKMNPGSVNYFSASERHALLASDNFTILMAEGKRHKKEVVSNQLVAYQFTRLSSEPQLRKHMVSNELQRLVVKDFHAEQLIALYLQKGLGVDLHAASAAKIRIGITKLCCETCGNTLARFTRIAVRGTHHVSYTNVADIFANKACTPVKTPSRRTTEPDPSPDDTPFNKASPSVHGSSPHQLAFYRSPQMRYASKRPLELSSPIAEAQVEELVENMPRTKKSRLKKAKEARVSQEASQVMSPQSSPLVSTPQKGSYASALLGGMGYSNGSLDAGRFSLNSDSMQSPKIVASSSSSSASGKKKHVRFDKKPQKGAHQQASADKHLPFSPRGVGGSQSFFSPEAPNRGTNRRHKSTRNQQSEQSYNTPTKGTRPPF
ncbi:MAG: hypothetical protein P1U32_08055 [Legionellaceae bacterium]|nr:hypothetical protein [Legionellaceae bacterium]